MSTSEKKKIVVPEDLREILLEFTISFLLEQPNDAISYAADYFERLKNNRQTSDNQTNLSTARVSSPDESVMSNEDEPSVNRFNTRRKSVFAETYNPEDDEDDGSKILFPKSDEQRKVLSENIKNIFLFRALDSEQMNDVLDAMFERKVVKGDLVIKQGDDGDNFYVIQSGVYKAFVADNGTNMKHIHTYENSGSFGELALLYNMPRAATVIADSDGYLWAMDRQTFRRIILKSAFKKRKMYESLIENVPMLTTLKSYERMNLADALIPRTFAANEEIIRQGDAADGMYFIEDGTVMICVDNNGQRAEVSKLIKGQYFGELALVTKKPRAASAFAETDVKLAFLDVEAFERLLGPCMQIMKRNIDDYEDQLVKIFGSKTNLQDLR